MLLSSNMSVGVPWNNPNPDPATSKATVDAGAGPWGLLSVFLGSLYGDCHEPKLVLSAINLEGIIGEAET